MSGRVGGEATTQCQSAGQGLQLNGQFSGVAASKSESLQAVGDSLVSGASKRSWVSKVKVAESRPASLVGRVPEAMVDVRSGLEVIRVGVLQTCEAVQVCGDAVGCQLAKWLETFRT